MTKERLAAINDLSYRLKDALEAVNLAQREDTAKRKIDVLLGNEPRLVSGETMEACWDLMLVDANTEINRLQKEFNEA